MLSDEEAWRMIATAKIEYLDDPHAKKKLDEQWLFIKRVPKAALAAILSSWTYFGYSFKCLINAHAAGWSRSALTIAWLSFFMQLGHAIPMGIPHLLALSVMGKAKQTPLLRLMGDPCPTVDVFVTFCGEELEVLLDTVRAAAALDYPRDSYRIVVLDDSVSDHVKTKIGKLRALSENVWYTTRGTKPKTHTKAANLNHGLNYVSKLPGGPSELVAVLDVDMIPSPHWLRALVPHILNDPKIAMANPPQRHYNIPDGDPLVQSMDIVFDVVEPSKNAINAAWCCGTGFVVRRDALDGIGGVPEESISEDILTSFFLSAAGWKTVYVYEDVQWGLAPSTITSHLKQAKRTYAGVISTAAALRNPQARHMTSREKYGALWPSLSLSMSIIFNMAIMTSLPLLLFMGSPLVAYSTEAQLRTISTLFLLRILGVFSYEFLASKASNYHLNLMSASTTWLIPFQFMTLVRFAISILTRGAVPLFSPSGLVDIRAAKSFGHRLKVALWDDGFIVHVAVILSLAAGIVVSARGAATQASGIQIFCKELFVRASWPPIFMIWSAYIVDCSIPLSYTLNPPARIPRSALVDRDPSTKVAYPTRKAKDQVRIRPSQRSAILRLLYCVSACVAAVLLI
ncbi:MAG: hypothetical protein Q9219_006310 [cf. Caloplaca sp. 3 TL-2023]